MSASAQLGSEKNIDQLIDRGGSRTGLRTPRLLATVPLPLSTARSSGAYRGGQARPNDVHHFVTWPAMDASAMITVSGSRLVRNHAVSATASRRDGSAVAPARAGLVL